MATEKVFLKGFRFFKPNENAPSFVKASVVLSPNELMACIKENERYLKDYKGDKQLKLQLLENDKGLYFVVDTYNPTVIDVSSTFEPKKQSNDLPF